jgi:hypothetical protein
MVLFDSEYSFWFNKTELLLFPRPFIIIIIIIIILTSWEKSSRLSPSIRTISWLAHSLARSHARPPARFLQMGRK